MRLRYHERLSLIGLAFGCAIPVANSTVFNDDERLKPQSILNTGLAKAYSNEGRIECPIPRFSSWYISTGWLSFSGKTVTTVAHAFVVPAGLAGNTDEIEVDPSLCRFSRYSADGTLIETPVAIKRAVSWWKKFPEKNRDHSFDFAAVLLVSPVHRAVEIPAITDVRPAQGGAIMLIAHHNDLSDSTRPRVTYGRFFAMDRSQEGPLQKGRITDASRLFEFSADSKPGSSGGMIVDQSSNEVIGFNVGYIDSAGGDFRDFDKEANFNFGLFYTHEMATEFQELLKSDELPQR